MNGRHLGLVILGAVIYYVPLENTPFFLGRAHMAIKYTFCSTSLPQYDFHWIISHLYPFLTEGRVYDTYMARRFNSQSIQGNIKPSANHDELYFPIKKIITKRFHD